MRIKNFFFLTYFPTVFCDVTFRVIAPKGKPSVIVNNLSYPMEVHEFPLYKVKVNVDPPVKYYYSLDFAGTNEEGRGVENEQFERELQSGKETLNEFFNRKITVKEHPALPKAYDKYEMYIPSKLFDDTHVATVLINCNADAINSIHQDPTSEEKIYGAEFIYATPYSIRTFNNATVRISGQSTLYTSKLSYKISNLKNDKNKELYKRSSIKLRAEQMDPTFLRDKIYSDILNSLGVPTPQNKFARLYINGDPIGLFDLTDSVANQRYLRETLNEGTKFEIENPLYKADYFPPTAWGDLGYYGDEPTAERYSIYYYQGKSMETLDQDKQYERNIEMNKEYLIPFLKQINNYPDGNLNMDIKMFLKFMAMEFLGGAVDNFWNRPGNYYIYKNMNYNNGQWLFLDSDFHFTFGIGGDKINEYLSTTIDGYTSVNDIDEIGPERPLIDNIRKNPDNEKFFIEVFSRLISTAFHIDAIFPRIDSLAELIRDDVLWDYDLPRVSGYPDAENYQYTESDFENQINNQDSGCENFSNGISIKCWIRNKGLNIASQLGFQYPDEPDYSKGTVETLVQTSEKDAASKVQVSIFTISIITLIVTLLF